MSMTLEEHRLWVKALRSGEYEQTTGELAEIEYDDEQEKVTAVRGFCCLGVYCAAVAGIAVEELGGGSGVDDLVDPRPLVEAMEEKQRELLGDFNDTKRWSFEQIADYLEEHRDEYVWDAP
jgi:hypothetical protein